MQPSSRSESRARAPEPRSSLLIVSYNFPPQVGGIEQLCVGLARALHQLGIEVHVIAKAQPGAASFDAAEPYAVHRYHAADLGLYACVAALLRKGHQRVLCMQWTSALWLAARRALTGTPDTLAIMVLGKEIFPSPKSPFPKAMLQHALQRVTGAATQLFAISHFTARLLRERVSNPNVHVLTLGVDPGRLQRAEPDQIERVRAGRPGPFLLSTGRLVPRKGFDTLLRALPALTRVHPTLHCFIAGDGPDRDRLVALAHELGVERHVEFLGRVTDADLHVLYSAADLFALLSRQDAQGTDVEGFGLVLLEAQAVGTPVVTTTEGGMPDAMQPDITGLLVDAYDPQDFAERAGALLADPERRQRMSQAALAYAREQTWPTVATRLLDIIERSRPA
jgi:phosphatidylinositol alpha-1,6-mannosyltransferase